MGVRRVGASAPTANEYDDGIDDRNDDDLYEDEQEPAFSSRTLPPRRSGDDAARRAASASKFTRDFKFSDDPQLIRVMSDVNIGVYGQHWFRELTGKQSFICFDEPGGNDDKRCPLCLVTANKPSVKYWWSIVNLSLKEPGRQLMVVGARANAQLVSLRDGKYGPLTSRYWAASKTGEGMATVHTYMPIEDRDLERYYGITLDRAASIVEAATPFSDDDVRLDSLEELTELARRLG